MLNCFGINKLHDFMMHSVMLSVGHIPCENYYSFQFSYVGSYVNTVIVLTFSTVVRNIIVNILFRLCLVIFSPAVSLYN